MVCRKYYLFMHFLLSVWVNTEQMTPMLTQVELLAPMNINGDMYINGTMIVNLTPNMTVDVSGTLTLTGTLIVRVADVSVRSGVLRIGSAQVFNSSTSASVQVMSRYVWACGVCACACAC